MFYSTNQSYHWKLNQSQVAIYGRLSNQIVRRGVSCNTFASEQYIHFFSFFFIFFFFSFHFLFIFFFIFFISVLLFLIFFFIQHFQQVTTQNSIQWLSLPLDFLRTWWLIVRFWYIFREISIYNDFLDSIL